MQTHMQMQLQLEHSPTLTLVEIVCLNSLPQVPLHSQPKMFLLLGIHLNTLRSNLDGYQNITGRRQSPFQS